MNETQQIPLWLQDPPPKLKLDQFKLDLFQFQNSGAIFLAQNANCILTDQPGLGKTPQSIAAFNALARKLPTLKCIVVCPASLTGQWADEIKKFSTMKAVSYNKTKVNRLKELKKFIDDPEVQIIISNYDLIRRDIDNFLDLHKKFPFIIVYDESQKIKNHRSKTAKALRLLSVRAKGNKMLTATPVFNNVLDLYGLFRIINPNLFGTYTNFMNNFTNYYMVPMGNYEIPVYQGPKNIPLLKDTIKGYVFGRQKKDVYSQLPDLTFSDRAVDLPAHHQEIYDALAESKVLIESSDEQHEVNALGALTHMQRCVDAVEHLNTEVAASHPKIDAAVEIVQEEFGDDKIIIYSKFTSTIDILKTALDKAGIKHFVNDGRENTIKRDEYRREWEAYKGKAVLIISSAGGAGLNLQAAGTIIFLNYPWSYGELLQVWGRIHRIGSTHNKLLIINLYCSDTIDEDIRDALRSKQATFNRLFSDGAELPTGGANDLGKDIMQKVKARAIGKL